HHDLTSFPTRRSSDLASELMIQFDVELPTWIATDNDLAPVRIRITSTRYVGMRIQIQNRLPDRVYLIRGDYIVQKLRVGARRRPDRKSTRLNSSHVAI